MRLTRTAIGLLTAQYRSVLRKCFLINVGLYALLAPAASLTTATAVAVTAMPKTAEASGTRHVYSSGTIDKVEETFSDNTTTNVMGTWIWNYGATINNVVANAINNTMNNDSAQAGIIKNSGSRIENITGTFNNNTANISSSGAVGGYDDGAIIYSDAISSIGTIDTTMTGNKIVVDAPEQTSSSGMIAIFNGTTLDNLYGTYSNNFITFNGQGSSGGGVLALWLNAVVKNVDANFIGNYVKATGSGDASAGAITSNDTSIINSLNGTFIGNYVQTNIGHAFGGVLQQNSSSTIGAIGKANDKALFIGNYAQSESSNAQGGAIYNAGTITGDINADFINNYVSGGGIYNYGGAILNYNPSGAASIGNIKGNFIGNNINGSNSGYGGAIFNWSYLTGNSATIGNIEGNFINNYIKSDTSGVLQGGAIFQDANGSISSSISSIKGNFIGNGLIGEGSASTSGGAIASTRFSGASSSITEISGKFINNTANSANSSNSAFGGAIYNTASITSIVADFIGNKALTNSNYSAGGAIYNQGTINSVIGNFINNKVSSVVEDDLARGGAIYNYGNMTIKDSTFYGNEAWRGGAIYADTYSKTNVIAENKDVIFKDNKTTDVSGVLITYGDVGFVGKNGHRVIFDGNGSRSYGAIYIDQYDAVNIENALFKNNTAGHWGIIQNQGELALTNTDFISNVNDSAGNAISSSGKVSVIADGKDVTYYGNKEKDEGHYHDIGTPTLNLNASEGNTIRMSGTVDGSSTININGSNNKYKKVNDDYSTSEVSITQTGGDYVFNNTLSGGTVNLYNDANLRFGNVRQQNGTKTYGHLNVAATTVGEAGKTENNGATMNFANASADQTQNFGELTLNGDLKLGLDSGEKIAASSATGAGSILFDYINYASTPTGNQISWTYADSGNAVIGKVADNSTATVNTPYQTFTGAAVKSGNQMNVTLSDGTENLAGFLTQNATGTEYDMARDEQMLVDLGAMAGENNAKTVNANGHNIIGNQHAGVTLADGQTLTINDANVEGFYKEGDCGTEDCSGTGSVVSVENSTLNINNSIFRNNNTGGTERGGAIFSEGTDSEVNITDSSFYNNNTTSTNWATGAIRITEGSANIKAKNKDSVFEGNYGYEGASVLVLDANANISGENGHKVVFSNNSAYSNGGGLVNIGTSSTKINNAEFNYNSAAQGGAINNRGELYIDNTIFRGNNADSIYGGGAINNYHNDDVEPQTINISNSSFINNSANVVGGAIANKGTIGEFDADVPHETFTIKQHVVTNSDTDAKLTYYDAADVTAINNIIGENKKIQILTQKVEESKTDAQYQALVAAIAADTTHTTYAEKNPKLLVSIDNYYMPTSGGIQNTTFEGNYITANSTNDVKGGAIYNAESGYMNIEGSEFKNNLITQEGAGGASGAAIYNEGVIGNLDADFEGNNVISSNKSQTGGAVYNIGTINKITGTFTNNSASGVAGAVYTKGAVDTIDAIFDGNYAISPNYISMGGALYVENDSIVNKINGEFRNNYVYGNGVEVYGGAAVLRNSVIGDVNADFINNYSITNANGGILGGAMWLFANGNNGELKINKITGDFIGNYGLSTGGGNVWGGAINTWLNPTGKIEIGSITGDFKDNYAIASGSGSVYGGAIFNTDGYNNSTITSIGTSDNHAKFEGNYAQSTSGQALGGAIYNAGTIDNIYADFKDNYANSASSNTTYGGAIFNKGTIKNITGSFKDNYSVNAGSYGTYGGAIANIDGNIKITDSYFGGNYAPHHDGGAIYNKTIDGSITRMIINNSIFESNSSRYGAAVYGHSNTVISVSDSIIRNNTVEEYGGGAMSCSTNANMNLKNITFTGNSSDKYGGALYVTQGANMTVIDSSVIGNTATTYGGGLAMGADSISSTNQTNLIANSGDVVFRNNKADGAYNDVHLASASNTLNLNAASGKSIDFGGTITGNSGTLNINKSGLTYTDLKDDGTFDTETKSITQQGGDYIFRNEVSGQTMNLYDGADVQLRQLRQADGTTSYGKVYLTGMTVTGAGNILDTRNGILETTAGAPITQQSAAPYLGNLTLNNDLIWRLDVDLSQSGIGNDSDYLDYSSVSGSGKIVIDAINLATNSGTQTQAFVMRSTAPVKTQTGGELAAGYHTFTPDYKDKYTVKWSTDGARGLLNFTDNGTTNLNLVGYLSNDSSTATTPYNMTFDEPVLRTIGDMTGTEKTVNAGDYTINGNGFTGVTVGSGQTLNVNGGVWDGFLGTAGNYGVITNDHGTISISNAKFTNNKTADGADGGAISNGGLATSITGSFSNNTAGKGASYGGAVFNSRYGTITSISADFENNKATGWGGAISNRGVISNLYDSTFSNNNAVSGGAISNEKPYTDTTSVLNINATNKDVVFKNNTAGTQGGAIYNAGTLDISASNGHKVIFDSNSLSASSPNTNTYGGAIYNTGTLTLNGETPNSIVFKNQDLGAEENRGWGAAIYTTGQTTINNAEFYNNSANWSALDVQRGGGNATITNSNFHDNISGVGGAIHVESGNGLGTHGRVSILNTTFKNNETTNDGGAVQIGGIATITDSDFINNKANPNGGAIQAWQATDTAGVVSTLSIIAKDKDVNFTGNKAVKAGGAILVTGTPELAENSYLSIKSEGTKKVKFENNGLENTEDNAYGGAIANAPRSFSGVGANIAEITADFTGNYAKSTGEYAAGGQFVTRDGGGSGAALGGAIFNIAQLDSEDHVIENTGFISSITGSFINNYVYSENGWAVAGAIYNDEGTIGQIGSADSKVLFKGNYAKGNTTSAEIVAGAISLTAGSIIGDIYADFQGNYAENTIGSGYAGAFYSMGAYLGADKIIYNKIIGDFVDNYAKGEDRARGGAFYANADVVKRMEGDFTGNHVIAGTMLAQGGAMFLMGTEINTLGSTTENHLFSGNYATSKDSYAQGGAIWNGGGTIGTLDPETSKLLADDTGLVNTSFTDNYVIGDSTSTGGAIYNSGNINLSALQSDVNFWNNKANDRYNDIYNAGTMAFNAASGKKMSFGGSIEGTGAININTGATNGGTYVFKSDVSAGDVVVGSADSGYAPASLSFEKAKQEDGSITNGTFDVDSLTINGDGNSLSTRNDKVDTNSATTLTLNNALNLQIDGDLQSHTGDSIAVSNLTATAPKSLRLTAMNFTADPDVTTLSKTDTIDVNITGENDILAQNNAYTLASTNPDDTTEEQIEQAYLDNLTSSSKNYNKTYAFRSAKLMTSGNNQTYVQYGDAITLKWLYENYINGWSGGNYILKNVADGGSAVPGETLTVGGALMALDSALGKNDTYNFANQSVADVLVNNYYTKLVKKDEKFDTNEGIMDVKNWKKDTNSSQGRIIKGVSAFPSIMCAYPFDMPHTANDNNKNVIVRSAKHDVTIFGRQSDNTATTAQQAA